MKESVLKYMNEELLPRISKYSKPTKTQQTIIHLADKSKTETLTDDEKTILDLEVRAEKAAELLYEKRQKANRVRNDIEKKKKEEERKQLTREKIVVGALLLKRAENDSEMRQVLLKLFNSTNVAEKDKRVLNRISERLNIPLPESESESESESPNESEYLNELAEQHQEETNPYEPNPLEGWTNI